jgi:hypothetical protein
MANHLCAFYASVDSATLTAITTLVDDVLTRPATDRYQVPADCNAIHWAAALGPYVTRAQIVSPTLEVRRMSCDIVPIERGASAFTLTGPRIWVPKAEVTLTPTENFQLFGSEDGSGATAIYGVIALKTPGALPAMPAGEIRVVRATASVTLTANAWTTLTPSFEKDLEPGTYALVGFIPSSAGCIAARAIITGQPYRPGVPGVSGSIPAGLAHDYKFYDQVMWYDMGHFTNITPPQFQFLSASADTSELIYLYVVKIG